VKKWSGTYDGQQFRELRSRYSGLPATALLGGRAGLGTHRSAVETNHVKMESFGIDRMRASRARHRGGHLGYRLLKQWFRVPLRAAGAFVSTFFAAKSSSALRLHSSVSHTIYIVIVQKP
jgi:hypothetical protein